jgi:hypothetical protein
MCGRRPVADRGAARRLAKTPMAPKMSPTKEHSAPAATSAEHPARPSDTYSIGTASLLLLALRTTVAAPQRAADGLLFSGGKELAPLHDRRTQYSLQKSCNDQPFVTRRTALPSAVVTGRVRHGPVSSSPRGREGEGAKAGSTCQVPGLAPPDVDTLTAMNRSIMALTCSGASSGTKCPALTTCP